MHDSKATHRRGFLSAQGASGRPAGIGRLALDVRRELNHAPALPCRTFLALRRSTRLPGSPPSKTNNPLRNIRRGLLPSARGLLLVASPICRVLERVGAPLGVFANGVGRFFLGVGFPLARFANGVGDFLFGVGPILKGFFPSFLLWRITGHCAEPEQGGTK